MELLSRIKPGISPAASGKIYPSMDAAVEARLQTVAKWPGSQTLEEASARILVGRCMHALHALMHTHARIGRSHFLSLIHTGAARRGPRR